MKGNTPAQGEIIATQLKYTDILQNLSPQPANNFQSNVVHILWWGEFKIVQTKGQVLFMGGDRLQKLDGESLK
jgi:hypothetical protein